MRHSFCSDTGDTYLVFDYDDADADELTFKRSNDLMEQVVKLANYCVDPYCYTEIITTRSLDFETIEFFEKIIKKSILKQEVENIINKIISEKSIKISRQTGSCLLDHQCLSLDTVTGDCNEFKI